MFNEVKERLPFKYVVADSICGESEDFPEATESHVGVTCFVQVSCGTLFRLQEPATETGTYRRKGEFRSERIVPKTEKDPMRPDKFARGFHEVFRYRHTVSEGSKGPIDYEFAGRRITICKKGVPQRTVRLVIKRNLNKKDRRYRFYISNALLTTSLSAFVWLSGIRWAVGQCFEEARAELGMDHYEVRKYTGWNHHIMTCIPAHFFLRHLRIRLGKKAPLITLSQLRILLKAVLPIKICDRDALFELVLRIQIKISVPIFATGREGCVGRLDKLRCRVL